MKLYHATMEDDAKLILEHGFKDGSGVCLPGVECAVWFSFEPAPYGDTTLIVEVPDEFQELYEVVYDNNGPESREFLIPADVVNQYPCEILP